MSSTTAMKHADELLHTMTIEEKAMQLSAVYPMGLLGPDGPIHSQLDAQLGHGIGHVCGLGTFGHKTPETIAKTVNAIQHYLVTETRLKIPAIFHNEALYGVVAPHFAHFPTSIGLAATWDPDAVEEMANLMRRQLQSVGLHQALSPVLDVARDAPWGRVYETYGEDPYLVSALGVAFVRGMQGNNLSDGVIASAKHFLGYAATEAGQNMAATAVGPRDLHDLYTRPFEAAIRLAGLGSVMASYAEYEGVPIHVSHEVLTRLLRERLGFTGTVVSDYVGVGWAQTRQRVADTPEEVGALALAPGMDVELPVVHGYGQVLVKAVESGAVPESLLDGSVRRVLRDKFALGLFDDPTCSLNARACPGAHSRAGSGRRRESLPWRGSPMYASTAPASSWRRRRAGREDRPPHGSRRASVSSSDVPPPRRHIAPGVPLPLPPPRDIRLIPHNPKVIGHLGVVDVRVRGSACRETPRVRRIRRLVASGCGRLFLAVGEVSGGGMGEASGARAVSGLIR